MGQVLYQEFGGATEDATEPRPRGSEFTDAGRVMTEDEIIAAVRGAIHAELDSRDRIDGQTHKIHHAFIEDLIERSRRRRKLVDAIMPQIIGWGIIAIVGWIGYAVYQGIRSAMQ